MSTATLERNLAIDGMTCASCVARVERALQRVPGVASASVNLATEKAQVVLDGESNKVSDDALVAAVSQAGYGATLLLPESSALPGVTPAPATPWWPVALAAA